MAKPTQALMVEDSPENRLHWHILRGDYISPGSSLLETVRRCSACPLRPKTMCIDGKTVDVPASCAHYNTSPDFSCPIGAAHFKKRMVNYFKLLYNPAFRSESLLRAMLMEKLEDLDMSRDFEIMRDGTPGLRTKESHDQILNYLREYHRVTKGEKVVVEHTGRVGVDVRSVVLQLQDIRNKIGEKMASVAPGEGEGCSRVEGRGGKIGESGSDLFSYDDKEELKHNPGSSSPNLEDSPND